MKTNTKLLLASALAGGMTFTALAPAIAQQAPTDTPSVEQRDRTADRGDRHGPGGRHMRGPRGGMMQLMCSDKGAERLEAMLSRISDRLELTGEQTTLLAELKTSALTAQTEYADSCVAPTRNAEGTMIDALKNRQQNLKAQVAAMDKVIPALEGFYDSLTDEQRAEMKPRMRHRDGKRHGMKHRGTGPDKTALEEMAE